MPNLAIFSRDHEEYLCAFNAEKKEGLHKGIELIWCDAHAQGAPLQDVNIVLGNPNLSSQFIDKCSNLEWFQSTWAGIKPLLDNPKTDYLLTGLKGVFGAQMREYVMAYILYFQRKIEIFNQTQSKQQWMQEVLPTLDNQTIGIMGLGDIGRDVASAAKVFGMTVCSLTASSRPPEADEHYFIADIAKFAQRCDYIVNLLPHTAATDGLCDSHFFSNVKPNAVFINGGRGNILKNDTDIVMALQSKRLKGAVLDVFRQEPLDESHPFWTTQNLFITNHTAASSQHTRVWRYFSDNLSAFIAQEPMRGIINFNRGY